LKYEAVRNEVVIIFPFYWNKYVDFACLACRFVKFLNISVQILQHVTDISDILILYPTGYLDCLGLV
jgi:hypothetical protein